MILKLLDNDDKGICAFFLPELKEKGHRLLKILEELKDLFKVWKQQH